MPSPLSRTRKEGVWTNVYRARVAHAMYSALQSDARIKSHDCAGMTGTQINDCVRARLYAIEPLVPNGTLIYFALLNHTHQKYVTSCIPRRHGPYTRLSRPLLSVCVKRGWARDYCNTMYYSTLEALRSESRLLGRKIPVLPTPSL